MKNSKRQKGKVAKKEPNIQITLEAGLWFPRPESPSLESRRFEIQF